MNPKLSELRSQIKLCEQFITLCDRVKQLERQQNGQLSERKLALQNEFQAYCDQIPPASADVDRYIAALQEDRVKAAYEESQLTGLLHAARIRLSTLRHAAEEASREIACIEEDLQKGVQELDQLYTQLEQKIQVDGFDPNTVHARLAELLQAKEELTAALKAEISSSGESAMADIAPKKRQYPKVADFTENDFLDALFADLARAKTSVEIVSPQISEPRAGQVVKHLSRLARNRRNVTVYMLPTNEQETHGKAAAQKLIRDSHNYMFTVIQKSGLHYNVVIIDNIIAWEGNINILGASHDGTMRRTVASSHVRELRHYLFNEQI